MENYIRIEKIGEGTYGVVFKGKHKRTGELVAIKKIRMDGEDEGIPPTAVREISLLLELSHPNIVGLKEVIMEETRLFLIFEYLTMDLRRFLDSLPRRQLLRPALVKSYLYQMLHAVLFCHRRRILHRDLKPQNLLVTPDGVVKVADFGLGRTYGIPVRVYTHEVVTLWYRAPEVLLGATRYSTPVDVWSLGCILAELATRKPLFQGDSEIDQLFCIFKVLRTPDETIWPGVSDLPDYKSTFPRWTQCTLASQVKGLPPTGLHLLEQMLFYNPAGRITAKDAIHHEYFLNLDKSKLPFYNT